ncbi:MAG: class C sortase, partial [Streptococcaceae bacterium]|nr:class C sortase [Streptococcaceae bacterium]
MFIVLGALGFLALGLYPLVVDSLNDWLDDRIITQFTNKANEEYLADLQARTEAGAYREQLRQIALQDPFSQESLDNANVVRRSPAYYTERTLGIIYVPSINVSLPIFDSTHEDFLSVGAAWIASSDFPSGGEGRHTVISAHSGLPSATLFTNLEEMKEGDIFIIDRGQQNYLAYEVFRIKVVEPDDLSMIQVEEGRDLASLLTCTPYMINTHRLIVTGERIPFTPNMRSEIENHIA